MIWVDLFLVPICALLAVLCTGILLPEEKADDRSLMQHFMVFFGFTIVLGLGVLSLPSTQRALNPELARAHALEMHPIYQLIKEHSSDREQRLETLIRAELVKETPAPEIFVRARPILEGIALDYLGFADEQAHLAWGRVALQTLQELQTRDPLLCFGRVTRTDLNSSALRSGLSAENTAAFQEALVAVIKSGYAGMGHDGNPPGEKLEFSDVQQRYLQIMTPLEERFGRGTMQFLERMRFGDVAPAGQERQICTLRIAQLELALKERPAMAARMLDSLLR